MSSPTDSTVDPREVERFSDLAGDWWTPDGRVGPLHLYNPVRLAFIRRQAVRHFGLDDSSLAPLKGMTALDLGCGGGLVSEPLARLGARVTGVDASEKTIEAARRHAAEAGLTIDYRWTTAETLAATGERFDLVTALEIIEHVANPPAFVNACRKLVRPGGLVVFSTLNRTARSFALGIVAAEYVMGWVPRGTHNWRRFVKPSEMGVMCRRAGLTPRAIAGVAYDPLTHTFREAPGDLGVNYLFAAGRPE